MVLEVRKMQDLRDKVEKERGLLKKIELAIPGFRGYRKREDLRIADSMLRDYIARILDDVEKSLKRVRDNLTAMMALDYMDDAGRLLNRISAIEEKVRHAEQGYMGLVGDYTVDVDQLNNLYEFDLKLIYGAKELLEYAQKMGGEEDLAELRDMMKEFMNKMDEFEEYFNKRRDMMLEVFA